MSPAFFTKKYIYEHAYKLDGNVSGKVKEVIDCISQSRLTRKSAKDKKGVRGYV